MSQKSVVITEEYNVMVNIEELIGATEYLRVQTGCHRKLFPLFGFSVTSFA